MEGDKALDVDALPDGVSIWLVPGVYTGEGNRDIDYAGKAITVRSRNGPENCIIDCEGSAAEGDGAVKESGP